MGITATTSAFAPLDTTSVLRPSKLACPSCARKGPAKTSPLNTCAISGTRFFNCPDCGGVWFNEKEVDEALNLASTRAWPAPPPPPAPEGVVVEAPWSCPCCRGTLVSIRDRRGTGAMVRRCLVCYGGWIDYEELLKARQPVDLLSRVGRFVRTMVAG